MILHKNAQKCPVSRGYAKVPVIMQMEALECGAASLAMILAYYGKWIPLEQVRADCGCRETVPMPKICYWQPAAMD